MHNFKTLYLMLTEHILILLNLDGIVIVQVVFNVLYLLPVLRANAHK